MLGSFELHAQTCNVFVVNELGQNVNQITVENGGKTVLKSTNGSYTFACTTDSVYLSGSGLTRRGFTCSELQFMTNVILDFPATEVDEVEITSKRLLYFDIGYLPPIKGVQIATGTSSIIQLERHGGAKSSANPRELFAKIPGLNIWESDGAGIQMGVGGRGLSPNRAANFNMRQNGYDISADALGYPESYYTPPLEALQSIEIIRGSASLQYGTQFGGLMNFVFKDPNPNQPFEFTSRNTVGNLGYIGTFNRISGTYKRWSYQAFYQLKKGDGYRPNSEFEQHQAFAQLGYAINEKSRIRLEYTKMYYIAHQPGGLTDKMYNNDYMQSIRERNWFNVDWNIIALHYDYQPNKSTTINVRAFGMSSYRNALGFLGKINQADNGGNRELIAGTFRNAGMEARLLKRYSLSKSVTGGFLIGTRYYQGMTTGKQGYGSANSDADFRFLHPDSPENSDYSFPSLNAAIFAENIFFINDRWTANAGVRLDYIQSAAKGSYNQYSIHPLTMDTIAVTAYNESNGLTRTVPLGGIGSSYKITKRTSIYSNFCMNYRAVNFSDIRVVNPNVIVDTNMRDEYGSTTEIGWRGFISRFFYTDIAFFHIFYGDKIGLAPQGDKKIRTNIGDARNFGVEFFTEFDVIKMFQDTSKFGCSIFANFSYIDAYYIRSRETAYIGKQVEYVSPILLRSGIKFRTENFQIQCQASYNSSQFTDASNSIDPSADAVIGQIPAYFVCDASARYSFKKYFQLEVGMNNIMNAKYYTRRATAYPGPGILPSDGRTIYITLQFQCGTKAQH